MTVTSDFQAALVLLGYLAVSASVISLVDLFTALPRETIRKCYHLMISFSMIFLVLLFEHWYTALFTIACFLALAYLLVKGYYRLGIATKILVNRRQGAGEVTRQIGYLLLSFSLLIAFFWGFLGPEWKFVAILGVMAWGFGDAAAALVGKHLGNIKLKHALFDNRKTVEGCLAMAGASAVAIFVVLTIMSSYSLAVRAIASLLLGAAGSVIEASSHQGRDTLSLPLMVSGLAYPLLILLNSAERLLQ